MAMHTIWASDRVGVKEITKALFAEGVTAVEHTRNAGLRAPLNQANGALHFVLIIKIAK